MDFYADAMDQFAPSMASMDPMGGMDMGGMGGMGMGASSYSAYGGSDAYMGSQPPLRGRPAYGPSMSAMSPSASMYSGRKPSILDRFRGMGQGFKYGTQPRPTTYGADMVSDVWESAKTYSKSTGAIAALLITAIVWNMNMEMLQDEETGEPSIIKHAIFMVLVGVAVNYFLKKRA